MNKIIINILFAAFSLPMMGQKESSAVEVDSASYGSAYHDVMKHDFKPDYGSIASGAIVDSMDVDLPLLNEYGTVPSFHYPYGYHLGWNTWKLHKGLNVSLTASVFSTFGSGKTWSGAGFSQSVAMNYAMPLTDRLTLAIGGYFLNTSWAHDRFSDGGLTALLNYQITDKLSAFVYAQKSLETGNPMPYILQDINSLGDRIGVGFNYDFTPSFSMGVSVETQRYRGDAFMFRDPGMPVNAKNF